jgi:hypothetical protein
MVICHVLGSLRDPKQEQKSKYEIIKPRTSGKNAVKGVVKWMDTKFRLWVKSPFPENWQSEKLRNLRYKEVSCY